MCGGLLLNVALLLCRFSLGGTFLIAGLRKMLPADGKTLGETLSGFADKVAGMAPLPHSLGLTYGYALPWGELFFGLLLVLGLFARASALLIALMLLSFIIALGVDFWPAKGGAFNPNIIFFSLALLLVATGPGGLALGRGKAKPAAKD